MKGNPYPGAEKAKPRQKLKPTYTKHFRKNIKQYEKSLDKLFGKVSRVKDNTRWSGRFW